MDFRFLLFVMMLIILALFSFVKEAFSQGTDFEKHIISTGYTQGTEVFACDVNQDGLADFISTGNGDGGVVSWWENNGYMEFIRQDVDEGLGNARSARAADLNNDGHVDIVAAAWSGNTVTWYENDGQENWTRHFIDDDFTGAHTVDIKDVNGDGKPDVLCSSFDMSAANSEIAWWENALPDTSWTKQVISTRFQQSPFIYGADIDDDGDMDILACGELNGEVYWWENDGSQGWTEHEISSIFSKAHTVFARDIDLDGDMDVIGAACMSSKLAWWENDGSQYFTYHPMGTLAGALWFDAADLDNDGDRDLYAGGQGAQKLIWFENNGNSDFTRYDFDEPFTQTFSLVHADFDNDSDTDLVAIGYNSNQLSWFQNNLVSKNLYEKPECVVYDETFDRYIVANIGNGSLVKTDMANNASYWVHGYGIFYGMCIADGILYTSDGDTVFGFHLATGNEVFSLAIPPINNLDGMTTDGNGFLYVIDTGGRMLKVDLEAGTFSILTGSGLPVAPQDCVYDPFNQRIVVAAYQASAPIVAVDPESGEVTTLTTNSVGRYDGITIDQYGNFYFATHVGGGRIHKYPNDFSDYYAVAYGMGEPTGLNYNQGDNILAVPSFNLDTVFFIPINQTGIPGDDTGMNRSLEVFPNPCKEKVNIRWHPEEAGSYAIRLADLSGKVAREWAVEVSQGTAEMATFSTEGLPSGIYLLQLLCRKGSAQCKLLIR